MFCKGRQLLLSNAAHQAINAVYITLSQEHMVFTVSPMTEVLTGVRNVLQPYYRGVLGRLIDKHVHSLASQKNQLVGLTCITGTTQTKQKKA